MTDIPQWLVVHPGDTLIVCPSIAVTAQVAEQLRDIITARLPDLADVLVLGGGCTVAAYRPNDDACADQG